MPVSSSYDPSKNLQSSAPVYGAPDIGFYANQNTGGYGFNTGYNPNQNGKNHL